MLSRCLNRALGTVMSEASPLSARARVPWVLQRPGRILFPILVAGLGMLVMLPLPVDVRLIVSFDFAALAYLALFVSLMNVVTPEQAAELSSRVEPNGVRTLVLVVLLSMVSIVAVGPLQQTTHDAEWLKVPHLAGSLAAICLAWLIVHIQFGLHYMQMYYDDTITDDALPYDEELEIPSQKVGDYWDFMYYSFTIAMCYQTSDVTITSPSVRRLTLVHAIFSFFYIVAIIGLVVNIVGNFI
jgi:uncharacterized membrane protein